jgi:chromosome segregation ATPase
MRIRILKIGLLLFASLTAATGAHAQSDADRLRDALRAATAQTRSLEDQRTALQAKVATAERAAAELKKQIEAAKADLRQAEKQQREAVEEFNQRLAQRDETLEKWKSAYEEAATVARSKDAERAKFESEATAFKASTKSCLAKNVQLVKVGRELLHRYEGVSFGDMVVTSEPLVGVRRVEIQNLLQDYGDKVLDQKVTP